jgi:hypothetical protein
MYIETIKTIEGFKIDHLEEISEFQLPRKITINNIDIWDSPGLGVYPKGHIYDTAIEYFYKRLMEKTKKIKFVLTVPHTYM